jgi:membrane fusion protein YbhG
MAEGVKSTMKRLLILTLALGFVSISGGCKYQRNKNEFVFSGTLEMTEHGVGFPVSGRLETLKVDEGDEVKTGQLIGTLERFDQAKREYDRLAQLLEHGGTNRQDVERAQLSMTDKMSLSPVDGVVLTKVHETGEVVGSESPVVIIGDRSKLWVRIFVPEGQINQIQMNQKVMVHFDGLKKGFPAHVSYISPQGEFTPRNVQTPEERVSQTFSVKVILDNIEPYLRAGVPADVTLDFLEEKP